MKEEIQSDIKNIIRVSLERQYPEMPKEQDPFLLAPLCNMVFSSYCLGQYGPRQSGRKSMWQLQKPDTTYSMKSILQMRIMKYHVCPRSQGLLYLYHQNVPIFPQTYLQVMVWMLGIKPGSFARGSSALTMEMAPQTELFLLFFCFLFVFSVKVILHKEHPQYIKMSSYRC